MSEPVNPGQNDPSEKESGERIDPVELARMPIFRELPEEELHRLAHRLNVREVAAQTVLIREGEAGDQFFVVLSGEVEVTKSMGSDGERLLAVRGPGEFVGELSLLNPDRQRTASVRTRSPVQLLEFTHADIESLLYRQPQLALSLAHELSQRLTAAQQAIILDLQEKNRELTRAYQDLQAAQQQLIEKERLERELQLAYEIQMSILPQRLPVLGGYDFGALIRPARVVGGDFFDLFPLTEDKMGVVIGDVADKGMPSAIFMARTHAFLYAEARPGIRPGEVLRRVNRHLMEANQPGLFVTVLYGVLDGRRGEFTYARAGHELPLIVSSQGEARQATKGEGQLLGIFEEPDLDEQAIEIPRGGMAILYTDGLTDGRDPTGTSFGTYRLLEEAGECAGQPAQTVCDGLLGRLISHQGEALQDDDVTIVCIRKEG
jgi:phosphoserine phosphatase RsbU/P